MGPRPAAVLPKVQPFPANDEGNEARLELIAKLSCLNRLNLVLDRHVWPDRSAVLRAKKLLPPGRKPRAERLGVRGTQIIGHTASEKPQSANIDRECGKRSGLVRQVDFELIPAFGWKFMEKGHMRVEVVPLGRKVAFSLCRKPFGAGLVEL